MFKLKKGLILRDRVVVIEEYETYYSLKKDLNVDESMSVMVELVPQNGDIASDISTWKYNVVFQKDAEPDWYKNDPEKYEQEFRNAVKKWINERFVNICHSLWTEIKDEDYIYYIYYGTIPVDKFGSTNNYFESDIRKDLINSTLAKQLKEKFGDKLVPLTVDLTAIDGTKDYGQAEGDFISIYDIGMFMKYGDKIPLVDDGYWFATPNGTPSRGHFCYVCYISEDGDVQFRHSLWNGGGIRPFFALKI